MSKSRTTTSARCKPSSPLLSFTMSDTHLSVEEVASKVGFSSRSHFTRTFHDHFGTSPLEFRKA